MNIFIGGKCWNMCVGCDPKATGSNDKIKSISDSLMIPRLAFMTLTFQEWEGFDFVAGSNLLKETFFLMFQHSESTPSTSLDLDR